MTAHLVKPTLLRCWIALALLSCAALHAAPPPDAPPAIKPDSVIQLFNGKDLDGFYTFLRENKYADPKGVFSVRDGLLRISGEEWGGITTKSAYRDYHLVVDWKWGEETFEPRKNAARDSGILVHGVGEDGAAYECWLESVESQIIEGGSGDIILVGGAGKPSLTVEARAGANNQLYWEEGAPSVTRNSGRFNWFGRDPEWKDVLGFRGPKDVAKPVGEWNRSEVICDGDEITNILNGVVVIRGSNSSHREGKIQIQSEGAEILIRRIELRPIGGAASNPAPVAGARLNKLAEMFESGAAPLGVFVSNISPRGAAAAASSSLDFVILDMEHTPFDMTRLEGYLLGMVDKRRILAKGNLQPDVTPIVRLPANGRERVQYLTKQVLDLGAFGVLIPHVETAEEALHAVRAARFPQAAGASDFEPAGQRGVGYGWAARYWGIGSEYPSKADLWPLDPAGELILWCMIESREGVENARAIAATPGVSGIFVGPSDLAFSLGVPQGDPVAEDAIRKVVEACKETGTPCGTLVSADGVAGRLEQGFRFLAVGGDSGLSSSVERALRIGRGQGSHGR